MLLVQNPKLSKLLQNIYLNSLFARMPSGKILKQDSVYVVCFMKKNGKITLLHKKHLQPKSTSGLGSLPVCKKHLYSTSSCSRQALELSTDRSREAGRGSDTQRRLLLDVSFIRSVQQKTSAGLVNTTLFPNKLGHQDQPQDIV